MAQGSELSKVYKYHEPSDAQVEVYDKIRGAARGFAEVVLKESKPSREQSLALTKIEEAMMWANAGVARNEDR